MKFDFSHQSVLVLAPHTDDGELGCGGTITKLLEQGSDVHYVAFSNCEGSLPPPWPRDTLEVELLRATSVLGVPAANVKCERFRVRRFAESRQDILQCIIEHRERLQPGIVLMPTMHDIHQDHAVIAAEGLRAFKDRTILCYELPWNNLTFTTTAFVTLSERHVQTKIEALREYKTQEGRRYVTADAIRSVARMRGVQIGCEYAEAFEVMRLAI